MNSKPIIITGCAGFIGAHLSINLIEQGRNVIGVDDMSRGDISRLSTILNHPQFTFHQVDAAEFLANNTLAADCMVHLASQKIPRYNSGLQTLEENLRIGKAVIQWCVENKSRLLFASTSDVYGKNPNVPYTEASDTVLGPSYIKRWSYALSKLYMEHLIHSTAAEYGLNFQIMRFFGCYGPGQSADWWGGPQRIFFDLAKHKTPIELHGDGLQTRSFIYISDLISAITLLINKKDLKSDIYNICSNEADEISIKELAIKIWEKVHPGMAPKLSYIPYSNFGEYEDVMRRTGSSAKAKKDLNWEAHILLEEGLDKMHGWLQKQ
jgi:UDP-glucose 4-epimerase